MFRKVYSEAVTAIPVNGGTYNLVLNTVNKKLAAFVACLSVLSYIATAIISAFDSMVYLSILWPDISKFVVLCSLLTFFIQCFFYSSRLTIIYCTCHAFLWCCNNLWCFRIIHCKCFYFRVSYVCIDLVDSLGICLWMSRWF